MRDNVTKRSCPNCCSDNYTTMLDLSLDDFSKINPTYNLDAIHEMQFPDHEHFPIVTCQSCGFVYSLFQLDDTLTQHLYTKVCDTEKVNLYKQQSWVHVQKTIPLIHYLLSQYNNRSGCPKFVDYGCGWGEALYLARAAGADCYGYEIGQHQIAKLRQEGFQVTPFYNELCTWGPFDIVICDQVIEHVPDPGPVLQKIAEITKHGSFGFFSVPNFSLSRFEKIVSQFQKTGKLSTKDVNPWEHLNYFTPSSFSQMLEAKGFKIIAPTSALTRSTLINNWSSVNTQLKYLVYSAKYGLFKSHNGSTALIVQRR